MGGRKRDAPASHRSTASASVGGVRVASLSVLLSFCVLDLNRDTEELSTGQREGFLDAVKFDKLDVAHTIEEELSVRRGNERREGGQTPWNDG